MPESIIVHPRKLTRSPTPYFFYETAFNNNNLSIFFFNLSLEIIFTNPLEIENCDSNSWLAVIVDFNGECRLGRVNRHTPANTRRWPNVVLMLVHRLQRCPNFKTTLSTCLVFAGVSVTLPATRLESGRRFVFTARRRLAFFHIFSPLPFYL